MCDNNLSFSCIRIAIKPCLFSPSCTLAILPLIVLFWLHCHDYLFNLVLWFASCAMQRQWDVTFTKASATYLSNQKLSSQVRTEFESQYLQRAAQSSLTLKPACILARKGGMLIISICLFNACLLRLLEWFVKLWARLLCLTRDTNIGFRKWIRFLFGKEKEGKMTGLQLSTKVFDC
jgi:hypothetical protein